LRLQANTEPAAARARLRLREWQAGRLARTHADLLASPRFGEAAQFFLSDLYGPKDFSSRDEEVERILPLLIKMLPGFGAAHHRAGGRTGCPVRRTRFGHDRRIVSAGLIDCIDEDAYAAAYRAVGCQAGAGAPDPADSAKPVKRSTGWPGSRC
jgi:hypothetical protein